ncbi:MAG TPA: hypothetical protein VG322_08215 [Candidatus Acidoferrales bacterium]|nr:hypothetical protein [Candidatus Acidoferrales bacterium]
MSDRLRTIGMLWGIYGLLMIAAAAWIIGYNRTLTVMWGAIISRAGDPFAWMNLFHVVLVATVVIALVSAAFSLLAAFTMMSGARSSRRLGLIAAAFGMLGTPPGVALGVFTVAMLFPMRSSG